MPETCPPFVNSLWERNSNIRWSWKDLFFYNITDIDVYNARFQDFIDFYDNFYRQGGVNRFFPKDHEATIIHDRL